MSKRLIISTSDTLPLMLAAVLDSGFDISEPKPKIDPHKPFTEHDQARIDMAEQKRQRKAAIRARKGKD